MLKMPVLALSKTFSDRLDAWVRNGGRLMVIADHTDLYNNAQNLNDFLTGFGVRINSDAVFDPAGFLTKPKTDRIGAVLGRIDAFGQTMPWQTGASLAAMPINTVSLATFGLSFSEPGDYSRDNRFGSLIPRSSLRLMAHSAVTAFAVGKGAVAIVLDSTPWSTFSIFKEQYTHLFKGIIHALSHVAALRVWGWGAVALALITLLAAFTRHHLVILAAAFLLGLTIGSAVQIGVCVVCRTGRRSGFQVKSCIGRKKQA